MHRTVSFIRFRLRIVLSLRVCLHRMSYSHVTKFCLFFFSSNVSVVVPAEAADAAASIYFPKSSNDDSSRGGDVIFHPFRRRRCRREVITLARVMQLRGIANGDIRNLFHALQ